MALPSLSTSSSPEFTFPKKIQLSSAGDLKKKLTSQEDKFCDIKSLTEQTLGFSKINRLERIKFSTTEAKHEWVCC